MNKLASVKVITVVQVGNHRYSTSLPAAEEYALHACSKLWDKYRHKYVNGDDNEFYWEIRHRMIRRILPIFQRVLGA